MTSIIKVNTIQDLSSTVLFSSDGSGNIQTQKLNYPSFRVRLSSNQSISNDTWTKIQFNTEDWDTNTAYDNSTNYRFTVPTGLSGKYLFCYTAVIGDLNDGKRGAVRLYLNGSGNNYGRENSYSSSTGANTYSNGQLMVDLSASDYVELYAYQNNGNSQTIYSTSIFTGMRIGS